MVFFVHLFDTTYNANCHDFSLFVPLHKQRSFCPWKNLLLLKTNDNFRFASLRFFCSQFSTTESGQIWNFPPLEQINKRNRKSGAAGIEPATCSARAPRANHHATAKLAFLIPCLKRWAGPPRPAFFFDSHFTAACVGLVRYPGYYSFHFSYAFKMRGELFVIYGEHFLNLL